MKFPKTPCFMDAVEKIHAWEKAIFVIWQILEKGGAYE